MGIRLIQDIAKRGSDADGLTPRDKAAVRRRWRGTFTRPEVDAALHIFGDLKVTGAERRRLLSFVVPLTKHGNLLLRFRLETKLGDIIGRYGRRIRERHMIAMLRNIKASRDPKTQYTLIRNVDRMSPRHEVRLLGPLGNICRSATIDLKTVDRACCVFDKIRKNRDDCRLPKYSSGIRHLVSYIKRLPVQHRIGLISKLLRINQYHIQYLAPALRSLDPLLAMLTVDKTFFPPNLLPHVFPFLNAVNREHAIARAMEVVRRGHPRLNLLKGFLLRTLSGTTASNRALIKEGLDLATFKRKLSRHPHWYTQVHHLSKTWILDTWDELQAIKYFRKFLTSAGPRQVQLNIAHLIIKKPRLIRYFSDLLHRHPTTFIKGVLKKAVFQDLSQLPYASGLLTTREREEIIQRRLSSRHLQLTVSEVAPLVPYLVRWKTGNNPQRQQLARQTIRACKKHADCRILFTPRTSATQQLLRRLSSHYRRVVLLEKNRSSFRLHTMYMERIPLPFRAERRIQEAAFEGNFREIEWLIENSPATPIHSTVLKRYQRLVRKAKALGITNFRRFHTTAILRTVIKNRRKANRADRRPLAVFLYGASDSNGAFESNDLIKLSQHYRVLYYEIDGKRAAAQALDEATKAQKATVVVLAGHADRIAIRLGSKNVGLDQLRWFGTLKDRIVHSGHIVLVACETGLARGKGPDVSSTIADLVPHATVHAPTKSLHSYLIINADGSIKKTFFFNAGSSSIKPGLGILIHRISGKRTLYDHATPPLLTPASGWDRQRHKINPLSYMTRIVSTGYRHGLILFLTRLPSSPKPWMPRPEDVVYP